MFYVQHSGHDLTIVEIDSYDEWPVFLSTTSQQQCQHDLKFNMNVTGPETNFSLFKLFSHVAIIQFDNVSLSAPEI